MKTVPGVSSIISATPVAFSKAVMLRPSFPMSFPLRSSLGSSIRVLVTSFVTSQAYCWMERKIISRACSFLLLSIDFLYFSIAVCPSFWYLFSISRRKILRASFSLSFAISAIFPSSSSFFFCAWACFSFTSCSCFSRSCFLFSRSSNFLSSFASRSISLFSPSRSFASIRSFFLSIFADSVFASRTSAEASFFASSSIVSHFVFLSISFLFSHI